MTAWMPRSPAAEEPACWSWPVPEAEDFETVRARLLAENAAQPTHLGVDVETIDMLVEDGGHLMVLFDEFHAGRCAICGRNGSFVPDHCHRTGQRRGNLCVSCNVREGRSGAPVFVRYRRIHPAVILDLHEMYDGVGWDGGWWCGDPWAPAGRSGLRPPTPWPVWSPDASLAAVAPC